jgi:hypothetical protein
MGKRGSNVAFILPTNNQKFRLFSDQHNGQFLFVSNDEDDDHDRFVEAHPFRDEERNFFQAIEDEDGFFRLFHPATGTFLFVSSDILNGDRVVQAHASPNEQRNKFEPLLAENGTFKLHNISTDTFIFLSNDQKGNDFVIEAHLNRGEIRNNFRIVLDP